MFRQVFLIIFWTMNKRQSVILVKN